MRQALLTLAIAAGVVIAVADLGWAFADAWSVAHAAVKDDEVPFDVFRYNGACVVVGYDKKHQSVTALAIAPLDLCQRVSNNANDPEPKAWK